METLNANVILFIYLTMSAVRGIQIDKLYKTWGIKYFANCLLWWVMWPIELFTVKKIKREIINKAVMFDGVEQATAQFLQWRDVNCIDKFQNTTHGLVQYTFALEQHADEIEQALVDISSLMSIDDVALLGDAELSKEQRRALSKFCFACYRLDMIKRTGVNNG